MCWWRSGVEWSGGGGQGGGAGQQKVYRCRSTKIKLEMVMDVVLDEVEKEVNEGLVLVNIHCDDRRGYHKVVLE